MHRILTDPFPARLHLPDAWTEESPVLILLHGRGSSEGDLQGLQVVLPDTWALLTPRAPFPGLPWGYGPGWAWYRYLAEDRVVPDTLQESLKFLDEVMDALPEVLGGSPARLVLGGFSQGGTTSLSYGLTRPGRLGGVAVLSGFLPQVPFVTSGLPNGKGLPVFWGHGQGDLAIPFALGVRGRAALRQAGAKVTEADHSGGHTITPQEARLLGTWLRDLATDEVG